MTDLRFYGEQAPGVGISGETLPGRLLVIEGTDGAGRSTQIALLKEWLEDRGYAVIDTGLRRSTLAGRGIERAKRGNTLDPITLNLLYAADFWDRMERQIMPALRAGMIALVDRYIFSLISRATVRGVPAGWIEDVYGFAVVPDKVIYLEVGVPHLVPRVLAGTGFDYWESGQDYQRGADLYDTFVRYQTELMAEFRRLAADHDFTIIDGRRSVGEVFQDLQREIEPILAGMLEQGGRDASHRPRAPRRKAEPAESSPETAPSPEEVPRASSQLSEEARGGQPAQRRRSWLNIFRKSQAGNAPFLHL